MLLSNRWRGRRDHLWHRRVLRNPLLAGQLCGRLNDIAMPLLSLNLGSGFSVDSICHLADCPGLAIQRTFDELFSNAPHFADALRIVLVNRLNEHFLDCLREFFEIASASTGSLLVAGSEQPCLIENYVWSSPQITNPRQGIVGNSVGLQGQGSGSNGAARSREIGIN